MPESKKRVFNHQFRETIQREAMARTCGVLKILVILALLETTLSLKQWKKFENGKVQSEAHEAEKSATKNQTEEVQEVKKKQHILHSHHGEKLNRHKESNDKTQPKEVDGPLNQMETHRPNKDRHHRKNAEKMLHSGHRGEVNKQPTTTSLPLSQNDEQTHKQEGESAKNDEGNNDIEKKKKNSSKKRSKPEGMSELQWRRLQKAEERRKIERAKQIAESWLNKTDYLQAQKKLKKKYAIRKMDGNNKARKIMKNVFRGPDRLVLK